MERLVEGATPLGQPVRRRYRGVPVVLRHLVAILAQGYSDLLRYLDLDAKIFSNFASVDALLLLS